MVEQIKISVTLQDDSLVIMSFVVNDFNGIERETTNENIENEFIKSGFQVKSWRIIQDSDILQDRTFRGAWKDTNNKIDVHMPIAREIHKNYLRLERSKRFTELDAEYMRADENGDNVIKNEIKIKKQKLRDITAHPGIESSQTPEELKSVWFDDI